MLKDPLKKPSKPSAEEVEKYLRFWNSDDNLKLSESSLKKLFSETYPLNNNLEEVLVKVCSLKSLYSLIIFSPITVAKHITSLNIDDRLLKRDLAVVSEIARVKVNAGKSINFYSFATKYCSHHRPLDYPIWDFYVDETLWFFKTEYDFADYQRAELREYSDFRTIFNEFCDSFGLVGFDLRRIDKYLWLLGKEFFTR